MRNSLAAAAALVAALFTARAAVGAAPRAKDGDQVEAFNALVALFREDGRRARDAWEDGAEFREMLYALLTGGPVGPGTGWFHPAASRYSWERLAAQQGVEPTKEIPKNRFRGPAELFARLDRDGDGVLRAKDFDWSPPPRPKEPPPAASADMPSRFTLLKGLFGGEIGSAGPGPKVDQLAPDFTLRTADGKREVQLSSFRGRKPVVLVFGSFT